MNLIPAKMLKAYRTGNLVVESSWAELEASRIIDAKLLGAKFAHIEAGLSTELVDREAAVSTEIADRQAAVSTLQADVDQNEEDADAAISTLRADVDALDGDFVSDDDFVALSTTFANEAFSAFVGGSEFTIADVTGLVAGTMSVFINGIEIHGAEGNFESGITLPFDIESSDLISIKYVKK